MFFLQNPELIQCGRTKEPRRQGQGQRPALDGVWEQWLTQDSVGLKEAKQWGSDAEPGVREMEDQRDAAYLGSIKMMAYGGFQ